MRKRFVFIEGGTGEMVGKTIFLTRESLALLKNDDPDSLTVKYGTMDAGGEALGDMRKLEQLDEELDFRPANTSLCFIEEAAKLKSKTNKEGTFNLKNIAPESFGGHGLMTEDELSFNISEGYGRNLVIGSTLSRPALEASLDTAEDAAGGFGAVVRAVVHAVGEDEIRVCIISSGWGGEGRTNICTHPAILKEMCIEAVENDLKMQPAAAKAHVEKHLKIGVIMIGAAFCFPKMPNLDQDIAGLVADTLKNYPKDSAAAVDAFYILDHDHMPVQARTGSTGGAQTKAAHAIELVACTALEDFFSRTEEDFNRLKNDPDDPTDKSVIIPHYSLPGHGKTTWANLALPADYRLALGARLRFDAMLIYWLRPQLDLTAEDLRQNKLYESDFLCKMYQVKTSRDLSKMATNDTLMEEVVTPFKALMEREWIFLNWLLEICQTGKDWEKGTDPGSPLRADLFSVKEIEELLRKPDPDLPDSTYPDIRKKGGMTGYCLDRLTDCGEDDLYHTKLTPDKVRSRLIYRENGKPRPFMAIMEDLYELCAETKSGTGIMGFLNHISGKTA